jgi:hypothetical protein
MLAVSNPTKAKHLPGQIQPVDYLATLWQHLTESLCNEVFELTRDKERQRKWSLFALLQVWTGLLHGRAHSQTQAVEACGKGNPFFPDVEATSESFFQRIQSLRPAFFHNIFLRFTAAISPLCPKNFAASLCLSEEAFPEILVLDGSKLHKVGRLLKIARTITGAILPGSLEAVYDLRRGILRNLIFDPDGLRGEKHLLLKALTSLPKGSLLVYDRYACYALYWKAMEEAGLFLLARASSTVHLEEVSEVLSIKQGRNRLRETLVEMGKSHDKRALRLITWETPRGTLRLLTNVMDLEKLPAHQALMLYVQRWSVERCFLSLKDTLNLNHLFNASPAAVGGQVFATAILYNALRLAQSQIAKKVGVEPERISPEKLFPRLTEKIVELTLVEDGAERYHLKILQENPRAVHPELHLERAPMFKLSLQGITLEPRLGERRRRRYCKGRKRATSYDKIPGAKKYVRI